MVNIKNVWALGSLGLAWECFGHVCFSFTYEYCSRWLVAFPFTCLDSLVITGVFRFFLLSIHVHGVVLLFLYIYTLLIGHLFVSHHSLNLPITQYKHTKSYLSEKKKKKKK
jgi:hypothetical protein